MKEKLKKAKAVSQVDPPISVPSLISGSPQFIQQQDKLFKEAHATGQNVSGSCAS